MELTEQIIQAGTGCNTFNAKKYLPFLQTACDEWGLITPIRIAPFLANIGVESAGLSVLVENLNYSADGLANTWPNRFGAKDSNGKYIMSEPKLSNGLKSPARYLPNVVALSIARKPQDIANTVYANRMGNGNFESGDGWRNRGQGLIQLTGHDNLVACMMATNMDVVEHPELLQEPEAAAKSAAWFFAERARCLPMCDRGDFSAVVKAINGAPPSNANHGPLRLQRTQLCLDAMK